MGDLVFDCVHPFVDRANDASIRSWIRVVETVVDQHPGDVVYVYGHARPRRPVTGTADDVLVQRDLLAAALDEARRGIAAGSSREEVVARDSLPGFPDHTPLADWLTRDLLLGAAYDELLTEGRTETSTGGDDGRFDGEGT